jgi:inhibitor of KinA
MLAAVMLAPRRLLWFCYPGALKSRAVYFGYMLETMPEGVQFQAASDQSLLVYFGQQITLDANLRVRKLLHLLESGPIDGVRNLHPAYCSLLIKFDALELNHDNLVEILHDFLNRLKDVTLPEPRSLEIPVCYGGEFGPDLDYVATLHEMSPDEVIRLHSSVTYVVYFLGFAPGYPYLGGLPASLATPRLATPRQQVPAGSIAIGGNQTGVYPLATPGGWRLIGRTPVAMFRPDSDTMSLLTIGDRVRFVPISRSIFAHSESR